MLLHARGKIGRGERGQRARKEEGRGGMAGRSSRMFYIIEICANYGLKKLWAFGARTCSPS